MDLKKIAEDLEQAAHRLADEPATLDVAEAAATCALASLVVRRWAEDAAAKVPPPVEEKPVKPARKARAAGAAKTGRPRGVPCPANEAGRHYYDETGKCKHCPAVKGGGAMPAGHVVPLDATNFMGPQGGAQ